MLTALIAVLGTLAGVAITSGYQASAGVCPRPDGDAGGVVTL
ncbi:hypothetical protein OG582_40795 (plasmid) [Streptomyces anulatus]